jgi:regulator of cell morphogenesis and NO signaling
MPLAWTHSVLSHFQCKTGSGWRFSTVADGKIDFWTLISRITRLIVRHQQEGERMNSDSQCTVGELVVERPSRARVFEKLGIDYCCGGKKLLQDVCLEKNLDYATVIKELDFEQAAPAPAVRNWASASLTDLCDHIEQTHHHYLKQELPRLEFLTTKVANRHGDKRPALVEVQRVFAELKAEMDQHMMKEERVLFPLCRELETSEELPAMHCGSVGNPIEVMIQEHEHAGDAVARIRALTDNYFCPPDACNTYRALFDALHHLERDLHEHVHKENNILFPKAIRLEKLLAGSHRV